VLSPSKEGQIDIRLLQKSSFNPMILAKFLTGDKAVEELEIPR
jgi:hypothetical protein